MNIRSQDLLSHEPTLWVGCGLITVPSFQAQSLLNVPFDLEVDLNAVYTMRVSLARDLSLSVQFLIHASSSICICIVWRICRYVTPCAFLMCAASASERDLGEPVQDSSWSPRKVSHCSCHEWCFLPLRTSSTTTVLLEWGSPVPSNCICSKEDGLLHSAQEWRNRTVDEHTWSKMLIYVSQTPNEHKDQSHWYNFFDTFYTVIQREPIVDFEFVLSNSSKDWCTTCQH